MGPKITAPNASRNVACLSGGEIAATSKPDMPANHSAMAEKTMLGTKASGKAIRQ